MLSTSTTIALDPPSSYKNMMFTSSNSEPVTNSGRKMSGDPVLHGISMVLTLKAITVARSFSAKLRENQINGNN